MESLVQIIEVCLLGLVKDKRELKCWEQHIDIIELLGQESFDEEDLNRLTKMILKWKQLMVELYGEVTMRTSLNFSEMGRSHKRNTEDEVRMGKKLSFEFPNFEVCEHWAELIHFLGPPWFQTTKLWEQRHQAARQITQRTNQRNITADVLIKVCLY